MKKLIVVYMMLIAAFIGYVTFHLLNQNASNRYGQEGGLRGELDEKYVMVTFQAGMDYWKKGIKGSEDAAKALNVSVEYRGATQYDANEENTVLEQVIAKKPAGIAVTAINPEALTATIDKAVQAGIPIVVFDSNTNGSKAAAFLGTDNRSAGATAARQLGELLQGSGSVAIITQPNQLNHQERTKGFIDTIHASYPNIGIVAVENGKGDQEQSEQAALRLMQQYPNVNGIFATEANGGIGVGNALIQTGKADKIKVISFDTDKGTLDMVKNGILSATLAQGTWNMGYWSLQYLFHLHHGLTERNGSQGDSLPVYTDTGITVVTKSNVEGYYANKALSSFNLKHMPIRYKLIVLFVLVSIVPSILLGGVIGIAVSDTIENQVNANTLQLIDNVNKSLESLVGEMQNTTYMISFNPEITDFLDGRTSATTDYAQTEKMYRIHQFLQGFTTLHSEIAGILIAGSDGDYISNDMYPRTAKKLTDEKWYKEAVAAGGIFRLLGHPLGRGITNHVNYKDEELVTAVRAILDPVTQQVKGVVLIDLKLRVIAETVRDVRLGKTGYLMVTDGSGETIYSPPHPLVAEIPKDWFGDGSSGVLSKVVDKAPVQLVYRKSDFTGWTTVGVFPMTETINDIGKIRFYIVCFIFLVLMIGLGLSYYLSFTITQPIWKLMGLMQKVETGNLTIRYAGQHNDEVGILGRAFNVMLGRIDKLIKEVGRKEQQKREAELRNLHAQIKPHFLYNTLDTIHWLAHQRGASDITEVVDSLSTLFRIGLSKGKEIIPLSQEIEHVRSYLKIQKTRYQSKLEYVFDIAPETEGLYVVKLIVQPLVENALYHGIKERRGPGVIRISSEVQSGKLLLHISDDGKGMSEAALEGVRSRLEAVKEAIVRQSGDDGRIEPGSQDAASSGGYGLLNVQSRLILAFGPAYGIQLASEPGAGTTVTIAHPYLKEFRQEVSSDESVESPSGGR